MATPVEQWLVNKAKNAESKSVAESWVLVAKTMSAGSYEMNSATYQIHCAKENVNDSARCLEKLYVRYGSDKRFWLEIDLIMEAFHTRNLDSTARFRQAVFKALLPDLQLCLLLELAAKCKSLASKNKCFVLSLRMFPEKLNTFGLEFLQILQDLASQEQSSENVYQQYLVCEVGPSLLRCQQLPLKEDICIELIHQILQFLLLLNNIPSPNHSSVLDPILMEKVALARSEKWNFLLSQIHLVAERLKWKDTMELTQLSMETIQKFLTKFPSDINGNAEWNILSMVIFCWAAVTYKGCYDQFFDDCVSLVLVPSYSCSSAKEHFAVDPGSVPMKKRKFKQPGVEMKPPFICTDKNVDCSTAQTVLSFAGKLTMNIEKQLVTLLPQTKFRNIHLFAIDCLLYENQYSSAIEKLCRLRETADNSTERSLVFCQLSSCYFNSKLNDKAIESAIKAVEEVKDIDKHEPLDSSNHYTLIKPNQLLAYATRILMYCLQRKMVRHGQDDQVLGHVLVLLQLEWCWSKQLFRNVFDQIIAKCGLIYPGLTAHLTNLEILEEISYVSLQSDKIILSITDNNDSRRSGLSTRHSSKGAKDEIKQSLETQLPLSQQKNAGQNSVLNFLITEKDSLVKCVADI